MSFRGRFTLRSLILLVTAVAIILGFVAKEFADRRAAARAYESALTRLRAGNNLVKEHAYKEGPVVLALDGSRPLPIDVVRDMNAATRIVGIVFKGSAPDDVSARELERQFEPLPDFRGWNRRGAAGSTPESR